MEAATLLWHVRIRRCVSPPWPKPVKRSGACGIAGTSELARVWRALGRDNISIMAAGIAYYAMLSIFPGMSALVITYGLVADPLTIAHHVNALSGVLPNEALTLLSDQLNALVSAPSEKLGIGLIVSVLIAVWSATSGTSAMMNALTIAYEGKEERGLLHFYGLSIALTIGGVVFVVAALLLIAGVPAAVTRLSLPPVWQDILPSIRFPMLAVLAFLGLGALYRLAPHRKQPAWDFLRPGTIAASLIWLAGRRRFRSTPRISAPTTEPTARWGRSLSCSYGSMSAPISCWRAPS